MAWNEKDIAAEFVKKYSNAADRIAAFATATMLGFMLAVGKGEFKDVLQGGGQILAIWLIVIFGVVIYGGGIFMCYCRERGFMKTWLSDMPDKFTTSANCGSLLLCIGRLLIVALMTALTAYTVSTV